MHRSSNGEDGYDLWLRYHPLSDVRRLDEYQAAFTQIIFPASSPTLFAAKTELTQAIVGLFGEMLPEVDAVTQSGTLIVGTQQSAPLIATLGIDDVLSPLGDEGFTIIQHSLNAKACTIITATTDIGVLYGVFHYLRHLQTCQPLADLSVSSSPKTKYRMLNHWDNLDGTVERGYAGFSLWDWHKLPHYSDPRYIDYARFNASIGINAAVLTNVNANALILSEQYLVKAAALADVLRPYGMRVLLPARFSAPLEVGALDTADPLDANVMAWWQARVAALYALIPDFGGFAIKANSEGQPGPHDFGRSHADGANMFADALAPYGGVVCWRAFVYDDHNPDDRAKQAYADLVPQDGAFRENVLLQVKNGPIDFQPREPFHPLFGAMPQTPLMLEVQITQEYLGQGTHLVYLAPLFKETLEADTYCTDAGATVAQIVDGSLDQHTLTGMAGVANIGSDRNWCGHPFAAANWYAFGRLTWDHTLTSEAIAEEWLRMTFSNDAPFVCAATAMMIQSREAVVDYMTPLGLHHIMARDHHYGPGPWVTGGRADWTSLYYHQADAEGIGFDRTASGSNAVQQYHAPYQEQLADPATCPEPLLLWFHHVAWQHRMASGRTLWDELCYRYNRGVKTVREMQRSWDTLAQHIDPARFEHVRALLSIQEHEARWWRDACLLYFQTFSQLPIPAEYEQPAETLDLYIKLTHYYVPGIPELRFKW